MMQGYASASKLRGGGPILSDGMKAMRECGTPPPRTVIGDPSQACGQGAETVRCSPWFRLRQDLLDQHVRGLDANADHTHQNEDHEIWSSLGGVFSCSRRAFSICWICSATNRFRARSRCSSESVLGGMGSPSGVRRCPRHSGAFLSFGLKPRMPSRASVALTRLMMVVCSPTRVSRSR